MASKTYTAQEMREAAECMETFDFANLKVDNNGIGEMLRQAADAMEREEREKKYEYAERCPCGFIPPLHTEKGIVKKYIADGCVVVRREVGEWEEVAK